MTLNWNIKHNLIIIFFSDGVDYLYYQITGQVGYIWNAEGPVYGPNGELELDPNIDPCKGGRTVFSTCKNNCPGGELSDYYEGRQFFFKLFKLLIV